MMGPREERPPILYFLSDNGEYQRIGKLEDVSYLCDGTEEKGTLEYITRFADGEVTGTVKLPRCQSRKRYVKLLMAAGVGKIRANRAADAVRGMGYSWEKAWHMQIFWQALVNVTDQILPKPMPEEEGEQ